MPQPDSAPPPTSGRGRARDFAIAPGIFPPGPLNAITDLDGVRVGHVTRIEGDAVRTGVTVVMTHRDNPHRHRVPAGFSLGNGYGKFFGAAQVIELGELETPIALTNTLSVPEIASGLIDWTLQLPGNEAVRSVNAVVGETNDSQVNDIRGRVVRPDDLWTAIQVASDGPVAEGSVGAGTGTQAFGWKGGIGTSSRLLPEAFGGYRVGVLIQTNYGGTPIIDGRRILDRTDYHEASDPFSGFAGSAIILVGTDAPILSRDLHRLAKRTYLGLSRTGSSMAHSSGEFALAFSTNPDVRRDRDRPNGILKVSALSNDRLSALFQAVVEATEEAVYNAMLAAVTVESRVGSLKQAPSSIFKP